MGKNSFKDEDKQDFVEFLNFVAKYAKFELDTPNIIKYFKLLSKMQQVIIPKIEANILEVVEVVENKSEEKSE